jgi:hypothetical protein
MKKLVIVVTGDDSDIDYLTSWMEADIANRIEEEDERLDQPVGYEYEVMTPGDRGAMEAICDLLRFS